MRDIDLDLKIYAFGLINPVGSENREYVVLIVMGPKKVLCMLCEGFPL